MAARSLARQLSPLFLGLALSCGPATPPAPPAELPSALIFPRSVGINVDKIRSSTDSQATLVGPGGEFSDAIASGADVTDAVNDVIDEILAVFRELEIPVTTSTTTFEGTVTDTSDGESRTFNVKLDFADYDLDRDGSNEGCSGHTGATPICYRLWLDQERFMAGIFESYPTTENPGVGRFRMGISGTPGAIVGEDFLVGIVYDHEDPKRKSTDFFAIGSTTGLEEPDVPPFFSGHIDVAQDGPEATAQKMILINAAFGDSALEVASLDYKGQWLEDEDFWSGSEIVDTGFSFGSFTNVCAQISTGNEVTRGICLDLGIDVAAVPFTAAPTLSDVALPADFPTSPTF